MKLEAWSLIGRIGHQHCDWHTVMTREMLVQALRDHGVPKEAVSALLYSPDAPRRATAPFREHISNRASRLVREILGELEEFPEMTIMETMEFAQERKHDMRSK